MKHFKLSLVFTVVSVVLAFLWGSRTGFTTGMEMAFIALVLGVLEVSLSFDNAVVNAVKLEEMTPEWQHRFITWGIAIAVFGMRLVFPVAIVSAFAHLNIIEVIKIAVTNPEQYAHHLHSVHSLISAFGGMFLFMLFLKYFLDESKEVHWIRIIEDKLAKLGKLEGVQIIIALATLYAIQVYLPATEKLPVLLSGVSGLILYLLVEGFSGLLEGKEEQTALVGQVVKGGLMSFLYLELIDASFSFDGVIGAFAISKDIVIISLGLGIGAMFVRSLTLLLVENKTIQEYRYLEHGAFFSIGALAVVMFLSTFTEVPEVVTGLMSVFLIGSAFVSSLVENKKEAEV